MKLKKAAQVMRQPKKISKQFCKNKQNNDEIQSNNSKPADGMNLLKKKQKN